MLDVTNKFFKTMAIVQNTLIGRSQNKVGGTVFSTWKGKNVLKSKPLTVANPQTDGQQAQRSKMRQLVDNFRFMLAIIRVSFIEVSAGSTEWASFMKYNLRNAFTVSGAAATMLPDNLTFSRGTLVNPSDMEATTPLAGSVQIAWTDNSGQPGANSSDVLVCIAVKDDGTCHIGSTGATRADEAANCVFSPAFSNTEYVVYTYFVSQTLRKASDSQMILDNR